MTAKLAKKVLVVDDDPATLRLIGRALERSGYFVILASDGARALTILEDNPTISLLVTDMQMPNMDGRELVTRMLKEFNPALPVIIISGAIKLSQITELLDAGVNRFMPKPPNIAHLLEYARALTEEEFLPSKAAS